MNGIAELRCTQNPLLAPGRSTGDANERGNDLPIEPDSPSPEEVRAELRRVVESPQFDCSERNRRFLEYVVEETLSGRADRIKGYNIATTVFGRDVSFDPQLDPVVRMEARRLRRSLERFYLTDGKNIGVKIELPKGGYVPLFQQCAHPQISSRTCRPEERFGRTRAPRARLIDPCGGIRSRRREVQIPELQ